MTSTPSLPELNTATSTVTALCVGDDPTRLEFLDRTFERDDRFDVLTASTSTDALERLDGVDCVVSDYAISDPDGPELIDAVRDREPELPFVLLADGTDRDVVEAVLAEEWTDCLRTTEARDVSGLLTRRVYELVDHRRVSTLARRALAGVEAARGGLAIAGPDGTFAFADRSYASRFGYDREELLGTSWQAVYTETDRLEATVFPTVDEGWRWTGGCVGRRKDGGTFTAETTVTGFADGSLVFSVSCGE